jgi:hypothetical protein
VAIPTFDPMLATADVPSRKHPVIEPKWDGVRSIITLRTDGAVSIRSRNRQTFPRSWAVTSLALVTTCDHDGPRGHLEDFSQSGVRDLTAR